MHGNYTPTDDSNISDRWQTVILTTRDLGGSIPINFVTWPGISLSTSCFSDKKYTFDKRECISNLLQLGFRRLVVDLYFDPRSGGWSLCPVASPAPSSPKSNPTPSSPPPPSTTPSSKAAWLRRQESLSLSPLPLPSESTTVSAPADENNSATEISSITYTSNGYTCSVGADIWFFFDFLSDMLEDTGTNVYAQLTLVTLNLRSISHQSSDQPNAVNITQLSSAISDEFQSLVYTPAQLSEDRKDINSSWLDIQDIPTPLNYYTINRDEDNILRTPDGWPTEQYLQYEKKGLRILFSFGDNYLPQGSAYDTGKDVDVIFPQDYLDHDVSFDGSHCPIRITDTQLSNSNTSWAMASDSTSSPFDTKSASAAINCGVSFTLNSTGGVKDPLNGTAYYPFLNASLWSWDEGEPVDGPRDGTLDYKETFRCTSMGMNGRWRVDECNTKYRVACRVQEQPHKWSISTKAGSYMDATSLCARGSKLGVPRNAVQNQFLLTKMKDDPELDQSSRIWVDWNSISVPDCWVSGGSNATCPYSVAQRNSRYIVIPTIAAVIVLVLFCLFLFVKFANKNFRKNRKRRKKDRKRYAGHDYEGVPS